MALLGALLGAAGLHPLAARAQRAGLPVVGYLGLESLDLFASRIQAFRQGLADAGYAERRNVALEFRWAEGRYDRLPALAADLVSQRVSVLIAPGGAPVALAAKSATSRIPIVFEMGGDPVALGVVDSLSRPGANLTGVSSLSVEASAKRLELLHEVTPGAASLGAVVNPTSPTASAQVERLMAAAGLFGLRLDVIHAQREAELDALFPALRDLGAGGIVFTSDPFFAFRSQHLAGLSARYALPAITQSRDFPVAGGLMSYGGDFMRSHYQTGVYAGRVLRGEKPAQLPVQQNTKLELVANLRTADTLGLALPPSLIVRADGIIE
nr:ABC transporter substrate-binding protein [Paracraurococcus ruber]